MKIMSDNENTGAMSSMNSAGDVNTAQTETKKEAKKEKVLPKSAILLPTLGPKKSYDLGDYQTFDMSIRAEREAALAVLSHVVEMTDDAEYGAYALYVDPRISDGKPEEIEAGSIIFDGKTVKSGDESVLAFVNVSYMPPVDEFYKSAHELTRRTVQNLMADFYAKIVAKHLAINEDGELVVKGEIPINPEDILTPTARAGKDQFQWALIALCNLRLSSEVKISARDLRLVLSSKSYALNSAYKSLETKGLFDKAITAIATIVDNADKSPEIMAKFIEALKKIAPKNHVDSVNEKFVHDWAASKSIWALLDSRAVATVKLKAANTLNEKEKAAAELLGLDV